MTVEKTEFQGVFIITPTVHHDHRGCFFESFNKSMFAKNIGVNPNFSQDNVSRSQRNVLRGLHYQMPPHSQAKLVSVISGDIEDFIVDLRLDSKTFGQSSCFSLSQENKKQLYIPKGFAHGFLSIDDAVVQYKVDGKYKPELERTLAWDDPKLKLKTTLSEEFNSAEFILSDKDKEGISFNQAVEELELFYKDVKQLSILD